MKRIKISILFLALPLILWAQQPSIPVGENLTTEGIPEFPLSLVNEVKNYTESRSASLSDWHPTKNEMLISTRFGLSNQIHLVQFPGGARKQITFFDEPIYSATYEPVNGEYFLFQKDIGGNEFSQIYRFELANKKISLLTDGQRSQNGNIQWNRKGDIISYASTKRNGKDRDIYTMNPLDPSSDKLIIENSGGGWNVSDWSPNDSQLLINEYISANESRIYIYDFKTNSKSLIVPASEERSTFNAITFTNDGKGFYMITNKDNEFDRLAYFDISTKNITYLTSGINWDVDGATLSKDGKSMLFVTNENGVSKLYLLNTETKKYEPVPNIPVGVFGGVTWRNDAYSFGFTLNSFNSSSDVYEYNLTTRELTRWTDSELGGMDVSSLQEPQTIQWKSFDGLTISGIMYKASSKFTGKRPVVISIHGGPEGQSRPNFLARSNYFINELGITMIFPNVRGSTGFGKTFVDLDNGMKREESVKDIGALIDWIATQPDLDKDRIMVVGGSYGGYMSLAVSVHYSDKIRCAIDIVGISNFNTFLKNTESYRRDLRRVEYGNERDPEMAAFFERIAPLNHTDKIKKPLFIIQGGNDPRVPYTESIQMKNKIIENGGTVWFLMANDEGHGFRKKNNIDYQFYSTIEFVKRFLLN